MFLISSFKKHSQHLLRKIALKVTVLMLLILLCIGMTYYCNDILGIDVLFTHFFYVPIILAAFWWGRRTIWVAILLGGCLIASHALSGLNTPYTADLLRLGMFILIGLVVGTLRAQTLKTEWNLRETRDYLDSLIRCANAPIIVWDKEGKITLFNNAFERLTGYQADEVIGKPLTTIFDGASKEASLQKIEQTLKGQRWEAVEIPIRCKDGKERVLLWNSANIYAPDGKTLVATIAQGQDITLRKQAEEALNLRVDELEAHGQVIESMLERRIRELAAHDRIVDSMLRTLDLDERLEIGLKEIMKLTGAEKAGVSLVEADRLVMRKQFGFSRSYMARAGDIAVEEVPSQQEIAWGWNDSPDPSSRLEMALNKERVKSWVSVPLRSEHGFLGILLFASAKSQAFAREQMDILSSLANSLTLMLEQASLYRKAQERLARLTTLREIDQAISANLSIEGMIEVVLRKVSPHIQVDAVGISLIDWERKRTILARLHLPGDVNIEGEAFGLSDSLLAQLGVEKRPVIIYDVKSDPRLQNHRDIVRKYSLSSYVGVPLVVQDRAIGVLHLFTVEPRQFSQEDLNFFATMAGQAAISVQNARLYEEAKRRAENMKTLAEVTFNFTQFSYERELATQMLASACGVIDIRIGGLFWYNEDTSTLELIAGVGVPDDELRQAKEQLSSHVDPKASLSALAVFTRKSIYVADVSKEPLWRIESLKSGSAYIVPLVHRGHLFGVYAFLSPKVDGFSTEQRGLADTFSAYVSSALQNVRLFRETQRAYEELQKTQNQLLHVQKMEAIGALAAGVAHDFNNMLTAVQGNTELALMTLGEDDPSYRYLNEVRKVTMRAANLTRQLLLFSRRQPMERVPFDLNRVIQDLTKMLSDIIGEETSLTTDLGTDLWTVQGDAGTIEQVIMNLVVNARDAMPEGGEITIRTQNVQVDQEYCKTHSYARPGRFVRLSVRDTGEGIDQAIIDRIFEPFFTTKERGRGTGMGLSVVYGIVKQHQGWITVESSPGQGSIFEVYLPAVSIKPEEEPKASVSLEAFRGSGERILLVEDEESVRGLITKGLSENGYIVLAAANSGEALDIFEREAGDFDLLFSDVILPDGRGPELAERLLKRKPGMSVLFTSGYSDEKSDWSAIREGGYPYLQKPYSLSTMLRAVRDALKR
ncbi:MAG: GAF domain-containing protein [Candidatus Latescibacteria bacterium]|nr:GAF domain-containing protein [Candidatus Latescibacterota bacterium]